MPTLEKKEEKEAVEKLEKQLDRKDFLTLAAKGLLTTAAAVALKPFPALAEAIKTKKKYTMLIDLKRCVGCNACTIACKQENLTPPNVNYNVVWEKGEGKFPDVKKSYIPRPCMHCEQPACLKACPFEAISKRPDGIVLINYDKCQGAQACVSACPYQVPTYDDGQNFPQASTEWGNIVTKEFKGKYGKREKDKAPIGRSRKCTFCLHKQDENGNYTSLPACVQTCMGKARHFGDMNDPDSEVSKLLKSHKSMALKPEAGTKPTVRYLI